jgi:hypothetical protein
MMVPRALSKNVPALEDESKIAETARKARFSSSRSIMKQQWRRSQQQQDVSLLPSALL